VELVGWMLPGTLELAMATGRALLVRNAAAWLYHGLVTVGSTAGAALDLSASIEKSAGIPLAVHAAGGPARGLRVEDLRILARRYRVSPDESLLGGRVSN